MRVRGVCWAWAAPYASVGYEAGKADGWRDGLHLRCWRLSKCRVEQVLCVVSFMFIIIYSLFAVSHFPLEKNIILPFIFSAYIKNAHYNQVSGGSLKNPFTTTLILVFPSLLFRPQCLHCFQYLRLLSVSRDPYCKWPRSSWYLCFLPAPKWGSHHEGCRPPGPPPPRSLHPCSSRLLRLK